MPVEEELAEVVLTEDMFLTIGVFDGVHLGHKKLLSELISRSRKERLSSGVITFKEHPEAIFHPEERLPYLTPLTERASLLKETGVESVIILSFTRELARMSAEQFVLLLKKYLRMKGLIIGADFALGENREGNAEILKKLGEKMGFSVVAVLPMVIDGGVVSSTAIRHALAQGDVKKAARFLGRPFSLKKRVTSGAGRGRNLGFPTANLEVEPLQALPKDGVYATLAELEGHTFESLTYIGERPTFGERTRSVEVYILNYQGDLYGQELKVSFTQRLRDEKKFATPSELKRQITEDIKQSKAILATKV